VAKKEHQAEKFVRLLEERFQRDLAKLMEWGKVDGRPMFQQEMTDEQELVLWAQGPAGQVKLLEAVLKWNGPAAVQRKRAEMEKKMAEYQASRAQMGV
jgi:hypothetical protein